MEKRPIGNDLIATWRILQEKPDGTSEPYNLEGKDLSASLRTGSRSIQITSFSVSGNILSITFYGKDQRYTGVYEIVLIENSGKPGMRTHDTPAFELVHSSREASRCNPCSHVSVESVSLTSVISVLSESAIPDSIARREYVDEELEKKQDVIQDLRQIRSGAEAGATAYQKPDDGIPKSDLSEDVQQSLEKANEAEPHVPGKGLSTNDYTDSEKEKLSGIESGAQVNAPHTVIDESYVHTDNNFTEAHKSKLEGLYTPSYNANAESIDLPADGQVAYDEADEEVIFNL